MGNDIELIVRCEHDAVTVGPSGELQFMNIKSLNEWDPKVWKSQVNHVLFHYGHKLCSELCLTMSVPSEYVLLGGDSCKKTNNSKLCNW